MSPSAYNSIKSLRCRAKERVLSARATLRVLCPRCEIFLLLGSGHSHLGVQEQDNGTRPASRPAAELPAFPTDVIEITALIDHRAVFIIFALDQPCI